MNYLKTIWNKIKSIFEKKMKFSQTDFDNIPWELSTDDIHTIIQDAYTIFIVFKKDGSHKTFPNTLHNRENLPNIRLSQELKNPI
jgi:hypothetical protein